MRDVSIFGWQAANFERYCMQQIGVLLVRERAKVGSAVAMIQEAPLKKILARDRIFFLESARAQANEAN